MSDDCVVVNASPVISLCKSGQEELLPQLFKDIVVPGPVWEEIMAGGAGDIAAQNLVHLNWFRRDDSISIEPIVQAWDLGVGETAVLSCALHHQDYIAVIDDAAARRCAKALNIRVIGTVGLIVLAKRRGLIQEIAPGLHSLKDAGLWLSEELVERLIEQYDRK